VLTCSRFVAGLNDYLDDALDARVRSRFERHVAHCARCRIVSETTRKTVELYRLFDACDVPPALESRLMAALRDRSCGGRPPD